ncbi:MAG: lytic transglycosylase domain-containing protein, partial [Bacteroidales bacterium]|nr:lytic transglycosylase domain-containing protein [Bacteroidales bacterium]
MKIEILLIAGLTFCLSVYSNDSIPRAEDYFKNESSSQEISVPEDFDNNLDSLLQEWHIKTFTNVDQNCDCDSINPEVSDEVMKKRLAEMPTIISLPYNKIIRQFIDMYSVKKRKQVSVMLGISDYYFPIIEQALEKYDMPNELKYMAVIESALNPNAVSRAGATGIWQFMFGTGKVYGLEINSLVDERRDPIKETDAAVRYMKDLYGIFGDWHLAIAAYNCGPGNVNKAIRRSGGKKDYWNLYYYLPRETRGYVPLFIAANYIMTYNKEHLICPVRTNYPLHTDTLLLNGKMYFEQISAVIGIPKEELKMLNPQYRRDIIPATQEKPLPLCMPANYTLSFIDNQDSIQNFMADSLFNQLTVEPAANVKPA